MDKVIPFLKKLKKNNHKEWFDQNRKEYEVARQQMIELVDQIIREFAKTEKGIADLQAKSTLFRINRDVRFSSNKDPYKSNFGANIKVGGKKSERAGYYIHIEPGECFIGGGMYQPQPEILKKIRQEIDYNGKELEKVISSKSFKEFYDGFWDEDKLKKLPKGFDENTTYPEWIKQKHFVAIASIDDKIILDNNFASYCVKAFKALKPMNDYLNVVFED